MPPVLLIGGKYVCTGYYVVLRMVGVLCFRKINVSILSKFRTIKRGAAAGGVAVAIVRSSIHFSGNIARTLKYPTCIGLLIGSGRGGVTIRTYSTGSRGTVGFYGAGQDGTSNISSSTTKGTSSIAIHAASILMTIRGCFAFPPITSSRVTCFTVSNRSCPSRGIIVFTITSTTGNMSNGHNPHGNSRRATGSNRWIGGVPLDLGGHV